MKKLLSMLVILLLLNVSRANNILVSNVSTNPVTNTIKFTVSWDNSWRSSILNNWDAAWVFLKYYNPQTLFWQPLYFTNTGNIIPPGYTASMGTTGAFNVGVFLYRAASGAGTATITDVELGIPAQQATGIYDIKAFAIEMVYVPQGAFYAGDGFSGTGRYGQTAALAVPGFITGPSSGGVYDPLTTPAGNLTALSPNFPNGYNAFYCMKYELSQGGYRDFLNCLTYAGQANHTAVAPSSATGTAALFNVNRKYIEIKTPGVASTTPAVYGCDASNDNIFDGVADGEWVACDFLNWPDQAAYLFWAGLRPITELEYEKAGRGIQVPVAGEYAWGNTNIATPIYVLSNPSAAAETVSNATSSPTGNANYANTFPNSPFNGPLRNGLFATATSNRISSGGSFYGVMEMSGNLTERVVTTATAQGQLFDGANGDGNFTSNCYAVQSTWPGYNAGTFYNDGGVPATGLIIRGGSWVNSATELRTSNRASGQLIVDANNGRNAGLGIRGGRTAP